MATQGSDPGGSEGEGPRAIAGGPTESSACRFRGAHHLSCRRRREVVPFREGEAKKTRRRAFARFLAELSIASHFSDVSSHRPSFPPEYRLRSNHPAEKNGMLDASSPALRGARRTRAGPCVGLRRSSRSSRSRRPREAVWRRATARETSRWRATSTRPRRFRHSAGHRTSRGGRTASTGRAETTRVARRIRTVRRRTCTTRSSRWARCRTDSAWWW